MSRHRKVIYEGDYDDNYYEEEDEEQNYVDYVLSSLGTAKKPPKAQVLLKLEEYNYNSDRVVKYFQKQTAQPPAAIGTKAAPNTGKSASIPKAGTTSAVESNKKPADGVISINQKAPQSSELPQLSSDLDAMGFVSTKGTSAVVLTATPPIQSDDAISDDDIDLNYRTDSSRPHLSLIVVGHVDSGKSTLIGHLLYKSGNISQRTVHKYEKDSQALGKGSFYLAWIMDETESEREHGVTIDIAQRSFSTATKEFTLMDSPGHRDFMPNMIAGCCAADVAVLVVPSSTGEFESSMAVNAQTREHATILKSMGINQLLVAVNKMDSTMPPWSESRFTYIQAEVTKLLLELNFTRKAIRFVPLSGLTGENILGVSGPVAEALAWYTGSTFMEALDGFKVPPRVVDKPLRAIVTNVIGMDAKGVEVGVSVLQGRLRAKRNVSLVSSELVEVKSITSTGGSPSALFAGEQGSVHLVPRRGQSAADIYVCKGMVIVKGNPLLRAVSTFKANIVTISTLELPIIPGSTYEIYMHGEELPCRVSKLYSMTVHIAGDPITTSRPKCIGGGRQAAVKVEVDRPLCMEPFDVCKGLGRFALRSRGKTCAVGIVTKSV